jgi:hypothetical protein
MIIASGISSTTRRSRGFSQPAPQDSTSFDQKLINPKSWSSRNRRCPVSNDPTSNPGTPEQTHCARPHSPDFRLPTSIGITPDSQAMTRTTRSQKVNTLKQNKRDHQDLLQVYIPSAGFSRKWLCFLFALQVFDVCFAC